MQVESIGTEGEKVFQQHSSKLSPSGELEASSNAPALALELPRSPQREIPPSETSSELDPGL